MIIHCSDVETVTRTLDYFYWSILSDEMYAWQ